MTLAHSRGLLPIGIWRGPRPRGLRGAGGRFPAGTASNRAPSVGRGSLKPGLTPVQTLGTGLLFPSALHGRKSAPRFPQKLRAGRPGGQTKPSIWASLPSRADSRPCTSRSQARLASVGSSPSARSASFSSLFSVRCLRCKVTTWVPPLGHIVGRSAGPGRPVRRVGDGGLDPVQHPR